MGGWQVLMETSTGEGLEVVVHQYVRPGRAGDLHERGAESPNCVRAVLRAGARIDRKLLIAVTLLVAMGMPVDAIAEPPTESIAEPPTDAAVEPPAEPIVEPPTEPIADPSTDATVEMPVSSNVPLQNDSGVERNVPVSAEVDEALSAGRRREATDTERDDAKPKKLLIAGAGLAAVGVSLLGIGAVGWLVVDNSIWGDEDDSPGYIITTGLMITGGVVVLTGASLAITGAVMRRRQRQAKIAVLPTFDARSAGVLLSGRF